MISKEQVQKLSKEYKINESIVVREYIQLLFLKELYKQGFSQNIFFKGGTAIRLLYGGERFSEDLDFTVEIEEAEFEHQIQKFFSTTEKQHSITFKEKKTIMGKTFLLTADVPHQKSNIFVKLDFSMREKVLEPTPSILTTKYPIILQSFIYSLSINEIFAEKIRAILTRKKHRDLYDLWILHEQGAEIDKKMINKKLKYYDKVFNPEGLLEVLNDFSKEKFVIDLRPFIPINERNNLGNLFDYIKAYLQQSFSKL